MATLTSYTLDKIDGDNYTVTFVFDDGAPSQQTICWGQLTDDPPGTEGGTTAAQKLDTLVRDYARAYQEGLELGRIPAPEAHPLTDLVGKPRAVTA